MVDGEEPLCESGSMGHAMLHAKSRWTATGLVEETPSPMSLDIAEVSISIGMCIVRSL